LENSERSLQNRASSALARLHSSLDNAYFTCLDRFIVIFRNPPTPSVALPHDFPVFFGIG
jgi:hypothetical protein